MVHPHAVANEADGLPVAPQPLFRRPPLVQKEALPLGFTRQRLYPMDLTEATEVGGPVEGESGMAARAAA